MEKEQRKCPYCGATEKQHSCGVTVVGSKRFRCQICRRDYTPNKKTNEYAEEKKIEALRLLALGNTGRGIGKALCMSKANAYRWARERVKKGQI